VWWGSPSLLAGAYTDGHVRVWRLGDKSRDISSSNTGIGFGIDTSSGGDTGGGSSGGSGDGGDDDLNDQHRTEREGRGLDCGAGLLSAKVSTVFDLAGHEGRVTAVCFHSPGLLCTASADRTARLWYLGAHSSPSGRGDGARGQGGSVPFRVLQGGHDASLTCCAISPPNGRGGGGRRQHQGCEGQHQARSTLNLTPYTLHLTSCTLHLTPCTLHPALSTSHPTPCTLHLTPDLYTLHVIPYTYTLHCIPHTLHPPPHPAPYALRPDPFALHLPLYTPHSSLTPEIQSLYRKL
jgi:hypothetical protein